MDCQELGIFDDLVGNRVASPTAVGGWPSLTVVNDTAAGVPDRPAAPSAVRGDQSAAVSWTPASGNGSPVTGYTITSSPGGITKTVPGDQTTTTIGGLTNGTAYTFTVTATNTVGDSPPSAASNMVTPAGVPDRPRIGAARSGAGGGRVTAIAVWRPETSNGGTRVTGYRVTAYRYRSNGTIASKSTSKLLSPSSRSFNMTLPVMGKYRFTVTAFNAVGGSRASARSNLVTGR